MSSSHPRRRIWSTYVARALERPPAAADLAGRLGWIARRLDAEHHEHLGRLRAEQETLHRRLEELERERVEHLADAGCAACHTPSMQTVDGQQVNLYSDLLLHETLPAGSAGIVDGAAGMTGSAPRRCGRLLSKVG